MKLKELLDMKTVQPVCVIDNADSAGLYICIDPYSARCEFWLTKKALEQEIDIFLTHEKYPDCLCVILKDD